MANISNKKIIEYLEIIFGKPVNEITDEEISSVETISISGSMNEEEYYKIDTSDLDKFPNLKQVSISDGLLTILNMKDILTTNPKSVILTRVAVDDDNTLSAMDKVESLTLINCFNDKYDFFKRLVSLKSLYVVNPQSEAEINLGDLSDTLEFLAIQSGIINNEEELKRLKNIKVLNLLWTNLTDDIVDSVNELPCIEELFITDRHDVSKLKDGVKVYHNLNQYTIDDDEDELSRK